MKKITALLLTILMIFSFAACNSEKVSTENESTSSSPIDVDENLLTVTVTLNASLFEDMTPEEIKSKAKEEGYITCDVNDDGSVTYTMSKAKHKEALDEMKTNFEDTVKSFIEGENAVKSFVSIDFNDDFSEVNIFVDPDTYTAWDNMNALAFYLAGVYYQSFACVEQEDIDVVVNFIDNNTKEVLNTGSYKDFVANNNSETEQ